MITLTEEKLLDVLTSTAEFARTFAPTLELPHALVEGLRHKVDELVQADRRPTAVLFGSGHNLVCGVPDCSAEIARINEDGYTRSWSLGYLRGNTWAANYNGSEDWSETGDGDDYLTCWNGHENAKPSAMTVNYR